MAGFDLFPYQQRCVEALVEKRGGICVAPARSGKTIIAGHVVLRRVEAIEKRKVSMLWICNTNEQKQQAADALECLRPVRHKVLGWIRHFSNCEDLDLENIDILIIDEGHHAAAEEWARVISMCRRAEKYLFTATPIREDGLWGEVEALAGPIVCIVEKSEVGEQRGNVPARVTFHGVASEDCMKDEIYKMVEVEWPERRRKVLYAARMNDEDVAEALKKGLAQLTHQLAVKHGLCEFLPRLEVTASAARDAVARGRTVLLLVYSVEQGLELCNRIPGSVRVFSKMRVKTDGRRSEIIESFRSGQLRCLIATSLADEGTDLPRADCLILAGGGRGISKQDCVLTGKKRSTAKIEQRTSRVLTCIDGKQNAEIHDFMDNCHGMLRAASWSRHKAYKMLGYDVGPMPR